VRVRGVALDGLPTEERARHVGLSFQDPGRQLFSRTVLDEVMVAPRALGVADPRAAAREALEVVGMASREREHPLDLAPQEQRRVTIAAAMAARVPLLILDEPTAGQDAAGREAIAGALAHQRRRGGALVITHDRAFARRVCDAAVAMRDGRAGPVVPAWELAVEEERDG
jgi:energy-coupling factor transport system ATP-binding protein